MAARDIKTSRDNGKVDATCVFNSNTTTKK